MLVIEQPDHNLAILLTEGNHQAFEAIYKRYWRSIYAFVFQQLGNKEDAEEVVHDLFVSLWKNRDKTVIKNLKIYLFISSRNLVNKAIRSKINFAKYREFKILQTVIEHDEFDKIFNATDFTSKLNKILENMPEKTAEIFRLSKIEEMSIKNISQKMNLSEKAIEYHITKSLKLLREKFKNEYSKN